MPPLKLQVNISSGAINNLKLASIVDNGVEIVRACSLTQRPTHLLLGLAVVWLQLQNLLETAAGSHGIAQRQVTLALSQMALWAEHLTFHKLNNNVPSIGKP